MDTSKEYLKMCELAIEIQKAKNFERPYSIFWIYYEDKECGKCGKVIDTNYCSDCGGVSQDSEKGYFATTGSLTMNDRACKNVWLPCQDQLQDLFIKDVKCSKGKSAVFRCVFDLTDFYNRFFKYYNQFTSMEQLWLAYIMLSKYDKVWEKEKWIIQETT